MRPTPKPMYYDPNLQKRLVMSDLQYAVCRLFYNEGPGFVMRPEGVLRIPGGTLNSLLDPRGPVLETTKGHGLRMTKAGYEYIARYEGRSPFKQKPSEQFCQQIRLDRSFRRAEQDRIVQKVKQNLQTALDHPRMDHPRTKEAAA